MKFLNVPTNVITNREIISSFATFQEAENINFEPQDSTESKFFSKWNHFDQTFLIPFFTINGPTLSQIFVNIFNSIKHFCSCNGKKFQNVQK